MLLSWLSILVLLTSAFAWLPAAAQDSTPAADPASEHITDPFQTTQDELPGDESEAEHLTVDENADDGTMTTQDNQQLSLDETSIEITTVSIDCGDAARSVIGSFSVSNPRENVSVQVRLEAAGEVVLTQAVPLTIMQSDYPFGFSLDTVDASAIGGEVMVTAREEGLDDATPVASIAIAISEGAEGGAVCGTPVDDTAEPDQSLEDMGTPEPTETADATPTATATPSPTPTATPDGGPVEQIVAVLVTILADLISNPPPADEPGTDPPTDEPPAQGAGTFGTVVNTDGGSLRCRTTPGDGSTITQIPFGARVETRGGEVYNWVPVICAGQAGWVSGAYFRFEGATSPTPTPDDSRREGMVSGTGGAGLRCRTAPVNGGQITVLPEGARVETRGATSNGWTPVKCAGQDGWVSAAYLLFGASGGGSGAIWIDVNLSTQYMRVYRGNTVVMETYVSTGRTPNFTTPTGTFYINTKLPSQTMSGTLQGETYHVPNVPWVMYFTNRGHAIHGAYWHNNFGQVMSHGCVNLPVSFSEWLYSVSPIGTRVVIHY
jgi:uncharacterized protein YraI